MEIIIYILFGLIAYNVPSIIAFLRFHPSSLRIIVLNIGLGWTVIGWFAALVWALMPVSEAERLA